MIKERLSSLLMSFLESGKVFNTLSLSLFLLPLSLSHSRSLTVYFFLLFPSFSNMNFSLHWSCKIFFLFNKTSFIFFFLFFCLHPSFCQETKGRPKEVSCISQQEGKESKEGNAKEGKEREERKEEEGREWRGRRGRITKKIEKGRINHCWNRGVETWSSWQNGQLVIIINVLLFIVFIVFNKVLYSILFLFFSHFSFSFFFFFCLVFQCFRSQAEQVIYYHLIDSTLIIITIILNYFQ